MADIERAELLRTWVAALRSGKYTQIRGSLRTDNGFCAVGVLCDLGDNAAWERTRAMTLEGANHWVYCDAIALDDPVAAMVERACGSRAEEGLVVSSNDHFGRSFSEIADEIERRHPDVFGEKAERGEDTEDAYLGADASALDPVEA